MWEFAGSDVEGGPFELFGKSIWSVRWRRRPGELAEVRDPVYGQVFRFPVYQFAEETSLATFAAGEFSNGVYGFFIPHQSCTGQPPFNTP
jgi:hypothetical protein